MRCVPLIYNRNAYYRLLLLHVTLIPDDYSTFTTYDQRLLAPPPAIITKLFVFSPNERNIGSRYFLRSFVIIYWFCNESFSKEISLIVRIYPYIIYLNFKNVRSTFTSRTIPPYTAGNLDISTVNMCIALYLKFSSTLR